MTNPWIAPPESPLRGDGLAVVAGAMKAGTTSLFSYLASHPHVCPSTPKEPDFFLERHERRRRVEDYHELFEFDPARHRVALDGSTSYTKAPHKPGVPERIRASGLTPRFIYLVRDPFARIESQFNYQHTARADGRLDADTPMTNDKFVNISDYASQLEPYRKRFGRERILVLDFDDLKKDPATTTRRSLSFIGLTPLPAGPEFEAKNVTTPSSKLKVVLQRNPVTRAVAGLLPGPVKEAANLAATRVFGAAKARRMTDEERREIRRRLAPGMTVLAQTYGVDVQRWGFDGAK
ncbi:MAG: sulfotransferase domain-containing protein [Planctomycetota bacterium]